MNSPKILQSKVYYKKRLNSRKPKLNYENRVTLRKSTHNLKSRQLAGAVSKSPLFTEEERIEYIKSTTCRNYLKVNEEGKMKLLYTCSKRYCDGCEAYVNVKRRLAYMPDLDASLRAHERDPKHHSTFWFVTLTKPTVEYNELDGNHKAMLNAWRRIYNRSVQLKRKQFKGIRRLEVTCNVKPGYEDRRRKHLKGKKRAEGAKDYLYHSHFHLLVANKNNAEFIKKEWLKLFPKAQPYCQKIEVLGAKKYEVKNQGDLQRALMECIKYLVKPLSHVDLNLKPKLEAYAWIFKSLKRVRTFGAFGNIKKYTGEAYEGWAKENKALLSKDDSAEGDVINEKINEKTQLISKEKIGKLKGIFTYRSDQFRYINERGEPLTTDEEHEDLKKHLGKEHFKIMKKLEAWHRYLDKHVFTPVEERVRRKKREESNYNRFKKIGS